MVMEDAKLYRKDIEACAAIPAMELPMLDGFANALNPWQVTTAADILARCLRGDTGVICADSMGLGKTISVGVALLVISRDLCVPLATAHVHSVTYRRRRRRRSGWARLPPSARRGRRRPRSRAPRWGSRRPVSPVRISSSSPQAWRTTGSAIGRN
jgi:hypothetical protein